MEDNNRKSAQIAQIAQFVFFKGKDNSSESSFIPDEVFNTLPDILKNNCRIFSHKRQRDIFLASALGTFSGLFNRVKGVYNREEIYANLNFFIIGPAASFKSTAKHAKTLGGKIHKDRFDKSEKAWDKFEAERQDNKELKAPPLKLLFIPANSSSAAVVKHLQENDECGIIFETEADSMTDSFSQDWGGYSDMLRKAFHHEAITVSRKTDRGYIEINNPKLSVVLTGTPDQVPKLIHSTENGLFSRFLFYEFESEDVWISVAPKENSINLSEHFTKESELVYNIQEYFASEDYEFDLTKEQWRKLDGMFSIWLKDLTTFFHRDTKSTIIRLGLCLFRIAMIFSILRHFESKSTEKKIICLDEDFENAVRLTTVFLEHGLARFSKLPRESKLSINTDMKRFYDELPNDKVFERGDAIKMGKALGLAERTIDKYLRELLKKEYLIQPKYAFYKKK